MNQILNSNGTILCKNIPVDINRFEITEIFSKYGPLLGEGIYFGKKSSNMFFIKYVHFKDAIKAYENLKDSTICEYDFKLSLSKSDEVKYKAIKGNKYVYIPF
ncbi:RNA-binding protein, putative [Plasmodium malariae]|uniref:RNA-binding protein, putative n=1 Tax=Plasmodium malariae TaxID=5858 RepID=A0A1C3KAV7_PLAMA|nr:RNA-binding protein, putative [Plasmodium malariae]